MRLFRRSIFALAAAFCLTGNVIASPVDTTQLPPEEKPPTYRSAINMMTTAGGNQSLLDAVPASARIEKPEYSDTKLTGPNGKSPATLDDDALAPLHAPPAGPSPVFEVSPLTISKDQSAVVSSSDSMPTIKTNVSMNNGSSPNSQITPEPGSLALLACVSVFCLRRNRNRPA